MTKTRAETTSRDGEEDDRVSQWGKPIGTIRALYRYPVKSTAGQALQCAAVTAQGMQHDRGWAAYTDDGGIASGKRTQRFRPVIGLMDWASRVEDDEDVPVLISPKGIRYQVDDPAASEALTAAFGKTLALRSETTIQHHDESPLHLLTTSSLAALEGAVGALVDERRFRANIIINTGVDPGFIEDGWAGAALAIGDEVVLQLGASMSRCVMVDYAQSGVAPEPKALKSLAAHNSMNLGLQARAGGIGTLRIGDVVRLCRSGLS